MSIFKSIRKFLEILTFITFILSVNKFAAIFFQNRFLVEHGKVINSSFKQYFKKC